MQHANPRRFSRQDYYRLGDSGVFARGERVELIDGTIVRMSPQNYSHSAAIATVTMLLTQLFRDTHIVGCQIPISLNDYSEPEPDFSLVSQAHWKACCQNEQKPSRPDLVIEISDSSYAYDTNEKASLYASAEIPEYWVLDLQSRQLEVRQLPAEVTNATFGFGYRSLRVFRDDQQVAPGFAPTILVPIAELLPPKSESA
jgi:Uma2 family endonuclease